MKNSKAAKLPFEHQQVRVKDVNIHVVSAGDNKKPAILFLHGFPETWMEFGKVMFLLKEDFYVVSIDLPGIGDSEVISKNDKYHIAGYIYELIMILELREVTLAGHDVGGMIAYAVLKGYSFMLSRVIIMNVVVPGVEPWTKAKQNPMIWHFRFHNIPHLPEILVKGHERVYFDYFFQAIAKNPSRITDEVRNVYAKAYSKDVSLKTAFDWYRTFEEDEKHNTGKKNVTIDTPLLYLRGDGEYGNMDEYLSGFKENSLSNVSGQIIPDSGHYAPEEAAEKVADIIRSFCNPLL